MPCNISPICYEMHAKVVCEYYVVYFSRWKCYWMSFKSTKNSLDNTESHEIRFTDLVCLQRQISRLSSPLTHTEQEAQPMSISQQAWQQAGTSWPGQGLEPAFLPFTETPTNQPTNQPESFWLGGWLGFYALLTSKVISGLVPTYDSAHLRWHYSATPLTDQAASIMASFPTQSH